MAVTLRTFSFPNDYVAVIDLWENAGPGVHVHRSDSYDEIQKKLSRDPELFVVAEESGEIIGAVMGGFDGRRGMIYHLAVRSDHLGEGIGKLLMQEIEPRLKAAGCMRSYLFVTADNHDVVDFYLQQGWEQMTILPFGKNL